jgi:hypothetical protein
MKSQNILEDLLPYAAEFGTVGFVATACVIAMGAAGELVSPGLVFNLVAPQGLVAVLLIMGALSLLAEKPRRSLKSSFQFAAVAGVVIAAVAMVAWNYFESMESDRMIVAAAAIGTAVLVFTAAARSSRNTDNE